MTGRESRADNALFYTSSLVEYISRRVMQSPTLVVDWLGRERLEKIYDFSDVYHCEDMDDVAGDFIEAAAIPQGDWNPVAQARYQIPTHWDLGKIYKRLILGICAQGEIPPVEGLIRAYHSDTSDKIHNFNSAFYYDNPENILLHYQESKIPPSGGTR